MKKIKKKNYPVSKFFLDEKVEDWMEIKNSFEFGTKKARFCLGWYVGENFRLFQLTFGEVLWDGEMGFLVVFDFHVSFCSFSFIIYPFD